MKLVPAKFAPFLVSNARPVILSPMALPVIQWSVDYQTLLRIADLEPFADLDVRTGPCHFPGHQAYRH